MKQVKPGIVLLFFSVACAVGGHARGEVRDPFWPIGENPSKPEATPVPPPPEVPEEEPEEAPRPLTDDELRREAQKLADEITKSFTRRATGYMNGRIVAYLQSEKIVSSSPWVSKGDIFEIELRGQRYRMKVVTLTTNHIELAPQRLSATSAP